MRDEAIEVGVIGRFSGARPWAVGDRFVDVDLDDFDTVMRRVTPVADTELDFCPELAFRALGDLRPESIARRVPALRALEEARALVGAPERLRASLDGLGVHLEVPPPAEPRVSAVPAEGEGQILDSILAGEKGRAPRVRQDSADPAFDRLLAEIADASVERSDHGLEQRWREAIEAAIGARLRAVVTHPSVRRLEALWRALFGLVRRASLCEGECRVRLRGIETLEHLAEVSLAEERPLDLIVVDPVLDAASAGDLAHLAAFAERVATPCLAGARLDLGAAPLASAREHPGAARLGVCLPRVLLRLPYGRDGETVDAFPFEELDGDAADCLWANPAFAVAEAVVAVLDATAQAQDLGAWAALAELPQYVRRSAFENVAVGPIEELFTESQVQTLVRDGLIPLVGFRNRDEARIAGLRSLRGTPLFAR